MSEKIPYTQVARRITSDIDYIMEEAYLQGKEQGFCDGSIDVKKRVEEAYHKGFEVGQHEATTLEYQQGLDDTWEAAKKIFGYEFDGGLPVDELRNAFGFKSGPFCTADILRTNTASEAIAKLKAYEEQQKADEIKVGDEVIALRGKAIVIRRYKDEYQNNEDACEYWYYDIGKIDHDATYNLRKTGRHFPQMAELVKAMKEGAE